MKLFSVLAALVVIVDVGLAPHGSETLSRVVG